MKTILLVENDPDMLSILETMLGDDGLMVIPATSAETAQALSSNIRLDMVITDWDLGLIGGPELISILRTKQPGLKAILITARAGDEVERLSPNQRPDFYLPKPFTEVNLPFIVKHTL
jgi:DNA-binding response OmpR family regulator